MMLLSSRSHPLYLAFPFFYKALHFNLSLPHSSPCLRVSWYFIAFVLWWYRTLTLCFFPFLHIYLSRCLSVFCTIYISVYIWIVMILSPDVVPPSVSRSSRRGQIYVDTRALHLYVIDGPLVPKPSWLICYYNSIHPSEEAFHKRLERLALSRWNRKRPSPKLLPHSCLKYPCVL